MSTVAIIRCGCTDFDEQKRIQGTLELPLTPLGRQQVEEAVESLRNLPLDSIYTAPGEPAKSTAEMIGRELGVTVKAKDELKNVDQGLWQGLKVDEVRRKFPKVFKQWKESPESICPPQGEMVTDAVDRIIKALHKPLKRDKTFAVVASEPLVTLIRCMLLGEKPDLSASIARAGDMVQIIQCNGRRNGTASAEDRKEPASPLDSRIAKSARGVAPYEFGTEI